MLAVLLSTGLYVGLGIGAVLVVLVIAVVVRGKHQPADSTQQPGHIAGDPPAAIDRDVMTATTSHPPEREPAVASESKHKDPVAPKEEPKPEPPKEEAKPAEPEKPATLEVEALSPSATGEAPMLGAEADEMRMGTDEMPKFGTGEMPALDESGGPTKYRTPAAQELSAAIESGECPKCKAPTFVGAETPEEVGADGTAMFKLEARCGACGHKANLIDMKVG